MIDLHVHSTFSDGSDSVEEIIKKANDLGITHLSITDHNKCTAYLKENEYLFKDFKGNVITGTEISTYFDGQVIHILAYNFNPKPVNRFLKKVFKDFKYINKTEMKLIGKTLKKLNIFYEPPTKEILASNLWSMKYYGKYLITPKNIQTYFNGKTPTVNDIFWEHISNKNSPLFCDFKHIRPSIKTVLKVVKRAGGICFVAHSDLYGTQFMKKLNMLKKLGIDGFECFYPTYTKKHTQTLVNYCKSNNLLMSAGSDYHGIHRKNALGTGLNNNLCKKFDIIKNWNI